MSDLKTPAVPDRPSIDPSGRSEDPVPQRSSAAPRAAADVGATLPEHLGPELAAQQLEGTGVPPAPAIATSPTRAEDISPTRPDIRSEEVGVRPPDHVPSPDAPASENAGLIFERS